MNKYVQNAMRERINDVPTIVEVMAMFQQGMDCMTDTVEVHSNEVVAVASIAIASRTDQSKFYYGVLYLC